MIFKRLDLHSLGQMSNSMWRVSLTSKVFNFVDLQWQNEASMGESQLVLTNQASCFAVAKPYPAVAISSLWLFILWWSKSTLVTSKFTQNIKNYPFKLLNPFYTLYQQKLQLHTKILKKNYDNCSQNKVLKTIIKITQT